MMNFLKSNFKKIIFFFSILGILFLILISKTVVLFFFNEKILVHRTNSIEKLNEVKSKFQGVELDVVFNSEINYFDVNHPPAPSIKLNLSDYLSHSKNNKNLIYWLDFKNLSDSNKEQALLELNTISNKLQIDNKKIIVETVSPEFIESFRNEGYLTSYYLPPYLSEKSSDSLAYFINLIKTNCEKYPTNYISFDCQDYAIVNDYFPTLNKLTWQMRGKSSVKNLYANLKLYPMLLDKKVHYVLLPYHSKNGDR